MFDENYNYTVVDRFLKYVKYDTQSDEESETTPSTEKQFELAKELVNELQELGLEDAHVDENCYVMATLPGNTDKDVPVIGFIAHIDTAPAVTGANVKPQILKNYQGGDIVLPNGKVIAEGNNPELKDMIGFDIIHTDGTTLLGADDKAGIAEIMDALNYLKQHPEIKHGTIKIGFTPTKKSDAAPINSTFKSSELNMLTLLTAEHAAKLRPKHSAQMPLILNSTVRTYTRVTQKASSLTQ